MLMSKETDDLGDYVNKLVDSQGVAVVTVKDGWVFTFTRERLEQLTKALGESDKVMVFVKSSEKTVKN